MDDLLEQVKQIDIRRVVEDLGFSLVQTRRMNCPFHEEDSPSLVFYAPPQNEFHCFGCGKHGDVINFYAEINSLDFKTALEQLAISYIPGYEKEGKKTLKVSPKVKLYTPKEPEKLYKYNPIHSEIYEDFQKFCLNYKATASTVEAANYLRNRGLSDWTIRYFRVFLIKNYAATNDYLKSKYSLENLISAGLMNERGNLVFYVHPIIFPYYENGKIIYLQGRTIGVPPDNASKYQFLKGVPRPMFNTDVLKKTKPNSDVFITEGAIDCMTLVQHGMAAVSLGSAKHFRDEWAKLFQKFSVFVWFDNDSAGQQGTLDLMEKLYFHGITVERKYIPAEYKDINEYFNRENSR